MRRLSAAVISLLLAIPLVMSTTAATAQTPVPTVRAGVGVADATWHVGAAAGQYTDFRAPWEEAAGGEMDPHAHATTKRNSYGVQSRLTIRAIVVEDAEGDRVALVKSDNYLAQDHLLRRVGQLLEEAGSGVTYSNILHAASHNHSSPYYATPSWGVWLFQDVMDLRMFEYQARAMRDAILAAEADLAPARMGATSVTHHVYKGNIMRPNSADDGSPAGFPADYGDKELVVLRFDQLDDDTGAFSPMASWINWGQHPESLDSYDLITADFLAPLERFVEQDTGAPMVFSQGDVGSAEGPYDGWNRGRMDDGTLIAWAHVGHAQTERGARILADSVVEAFEAIGRGEGDVPYSADFDVEAIDGWVPGPISHPYPSVSNCRSETTVEGDPGAPILGLPDCERGGVGAPLNPAWENARSHGIPVPDHYDAPSFTGVEENMRLRLQTIKLGEVLLGSCACEAQVDLIRNFESRANDVEGDIHDGFDWTQEPRTECTRDGDTWTCVHDGPAGIGNDQDRAWTFSNGSYERMLAQIHNDAAGWDAPENAVAANSEPDDPAEIWGNFTKEELDTDTGYELVVGVGHAGDYNGYTVSYREYVSYDHYRKALTSHGPHTADYMSTRMVRMGGAMNGGPDFELSPQELAMTEADEARQVATSQALGRAAGAAYDAWLASLPDDVGPAEALSQPTDITRFDAAEFTWRGGSNAVDNPDVTVERLVDGTWQPYAAMAGEVQTQLHFPEGVQGLADTHTGSQEWIWDANFEAFTGGPDPSLPSTPVGTYRFVVDGDIRQDGQTQPYHLESASFTVSPWDGIRVTDLRVDGGTVRFAIDDIVGDVAPDGTNPPASRAGRYGLTDRYDVTYPTTYDSTFGFVADDGWSYDAERDRLELEPVCRRCSFRPWAFGSDVAEAAISVRRDDGTVDTFPARRDGDEWIADDLGLHRGDEVFVAEGQVVDEGGNVNLASDVVVVERGGKTEHPGQGGDNGRGSGPAAAVMPAATGPTTSVATATPAVAPAVAGLGLLLVVLSALGVAQSVTRTRVDDATD